MTDRAPYGADAAAPLTPVVRHGLTDHVIDQLRPRIADGTWPLRHRLPVESALAKELGVGRLTIREAVRPGALRAARGAARTRDIRTLAARD